MSRKYKFNTMFRDQSVVIEYEYESMDERNKNIDCAIITDDNPLFIHPNYEIFDENLDEFFNEIDKIAKNHIKKVVQ